ncbi:unnamed protein product [Penicillium olsonii]|nr:unnamed protein product [Penicillium olsonii]
MIRLGRVVPRLPRCNSTSRSQIDLWSWLPYRDSQIVSTIAAMEHYSATVELRMPSHSLLPISAPLFIDTDLDTASVPNDCFIPKFLTGVKTPHFNLIAPGLRVPNDKEFARQQRFTMLPQKEDFAPAVLLFPTSDRRVDLNLEKKYLFLQDGESSAMNEGHSISTGLYSEPLSRDRHDTEEAAFRLLLPSPLRLDFQDEEAARMSDGRLPR